MKITANLISITELRKDASKIINQLRRRKSVYVLVNNKCKAVMIDPDKYEQILNKIKEVHIVQSATFEEKNGMGFDTVDSAGDFLDKL